MVATWAAYERYASTTTRFVPKRAANAALRRSSWIAASARSICPDVQGISRSRSRGICPFAKPAVAAASCARCVASAAASAAF
ncbi:hypothetical protein ET495_11310 [Xylanimonas allomyrinae]|uniref:Uncharacterized protein n=1 Tax=Xylanimonas allomyrinae TaxID=2509459 RepID=A0A4P6EMY7_9MICO|nr:hypothetical protein [Xylanimonas allomyrinae]QAY63736.1 hypothetical protein ET495_11310 [Xylanimonas allomyrinae]